jgi:hypothetical protein
MYHIHTPLYLSTMGMHQNPHPSPASPQYMAPQPPHSREEFERSTARLAAGQSFEGEDHASFHANRLATHNPPQAIPLPDNILPQPQIDLIYRYLTKKTSLKECIICQRTVYFAEMKNRALKNGGKALTFMNRNPGYTMQSDCAHVFHDQCLFSYLSEPSENLDNVLDCPTCSDLRRFARHMEWNAVQVELAMERVRTSGRT